MKQRRNANEGANKHLKLPKNKLKKDENNHEPSSARKGKTNN